MIGALYTLLMVGGSTPEPEAKPASVYGGGKRRQRVEHAKFLEQHAQHGNEAAIRFVIALAISGEE